MPAPYSPAAMDLGFGGDALQSQVTGETDEERKKRLQREQQMRAMSPAVSALGLGPAGSFGGAKMGIGQF